jgi:hypothetical protein
MHAPQLTGSHVQMFPRTNIRTLQPSSVELILQKRKFKKTKEEQMLVPLFPRFSAANGAPPARKRRN